MTTAARGGAFFRTMVLMGSSVAVSCGGMTGADGSGGAPGSGGSDDGTGGADASSGGSTPGTGGALTGGGGLVIQPPGGGGSTGGSTGGFTGFGGAYPEDCPTTQLSCPSTQPYDCSSFDYTHLALSGSCVCNEARPKSQADCDEGEVLVCLSATEAADGRQLDPVVPISCECVPEPQYPSCYDACNDHSGSGSPSHCNAPGEVLPDLDAYLCGCAIPVLK